MANPASTRFRRITARAYVWRTFSVTRLEQRDDGVYVEMEMAG